jgi:hypothetical protein
MPTAHAAYSWDLSASVAFGCHMRRRAKDEHKLSLAGVGRRSEHQPGLTEELPNVEYFYVLSNFLLSIATLRIRKLRMRFLSGVFFSFDLVHFIPESRSACCTALMQSASLPSRSKVRAWSRAAIA